MLPDSARDVFTGAEIPRRIRQLDFDDTRVRLEHLLDALDPTSISDASSIRLQVTNCGENGERLTRFLSSPFPRLSKLDIECFLPDSSSSIFTTSDLTSLKLGLPYNGMRRYTQSQFSQVL